MDHYVTRFTNVTAIDRICPCWRADCPALVAAGAVAQALFGWWL